MNCLVLPSVFGCIELSEDVSGGQKALRLLQGARGSLSHFTTDAFPASFGMKNPRDLPDPEQLQDAGQGGRRRRQAARSSVVPKGTSGATAFRNSGVPQAKRSLADSGVRDQSTVLPMPICSSMGRAAIRSQVDSPVPR